MEIRDAKKVVDSLSTDNRGKISLSTNQIRKFLAGINGIQNRVLAYQGAGEIEGDKLPQDIVDEIQYVKIKLFYQVGRNDEGRGVNPVRELMEKADIERIMDDIGNSKKKFQEFNRYIEAIVAYHRYKGGN